MFVLHGFFAFAHELADVAVGFLQRVKIFPSVRVDAVFGACLAAAQEYVIHSTEELVVNFGFRERGVAVATVACSVELLEPLDETVAVEYALNGVVFVNFFLYA